MDKPRLTTGSGLQRGRLPVLAGAVTAATAVWVAPLLLGPIAIALGLLGEQRGDRWGRWVMLAGVISIGVGLLFGLLPDKYFMT